MSKIKLEDGWVNLGIDTINNIGPDDTGNVNIITPTVYYTQSEPENTVDGDIWVLKKDNRFRFIAKEQLSTFGITVIDDPIGHLEYSFDYINWHPLTTSTTVTLNRVGDCAYIRGNGSPISDGSFYTTFTMAGKIEAKGYISDLAPMGSYAYYKLFYGCTSLVGAPELPEIILSDYCYSDMFSGCSSLTVAPLLPALFLDENCYYDMFEECTALVEIPLILPAKVLKPDCYKYMFYDCTSITTAPKILATAMADECCYEMFAHCESLIHIPDLPNAVMADNCCYEMFYDCTALETAPLLLSMSLAYRCYGYMFEDCTSLVNVPLLPATTLALECYYDMFYGCTSLTEAPDLPATQLISDCYEYMFENCTALNSISVAFTDWGEDDYEYTYGWFDGVESGTGTFTCPASLEDIRGKDNIPTGWTKTDLVE